MPSLLGAFASIVSYGVVFLLQPILDPLRLIHTRSVVNLKNIIKLLRCVKERFCEEFRKVNFKQQPDAG